jgi:hypothetical protein
MVPQPANHDILERSMAPDELMLLKDHGGIATVLLYRLSVFKRAYPGDADCSA